MFYKYKDHIPVLLKEVIDNLKIKKNGIYVDCTLGLAGHSIEILKKLTNGKLYCFEQDELTIFEVKKKLNKLKNLFNINCLEIINSSFSNLKTELLNRNINYVDGILYDLGISSFQLLGKNRGFSYKINDFLDMRINKNQFLTAEYVINNYDQKSLNNIFFNYGEEKFSKLISKSIIKERNKKKISTTFQLVDIIKNNLPKKILNKKKHPARKIFQAIRIEVNNELEILKNSLDQAIKLLKYNGSKLLVISFHSLEDRIVKKLFKKLIIDPDFEIYKKIPFMSNYKSEYKILTKKPIVPNNKEILLNNSSKSAKLRILLKK